MPAIYVSNDSYTDGRPCRKLGNAKRMGLVRPGKEQEFCGFRYDLIEQMRTLRQCERNGGGSFNLDKFQDWLLEIMYQPSSWHKGVVSEKARLGLAWLGLKVKDLPELYEKGHGVYALGTVVVWVDQDGGISVVFFKTQEQIDKFFEEFNHILKERK